MIEGLALAGGRAPVADAYIRDFAGKFVDVPNFWKIYQSQALAVVATHNVVCAFRPRTITARSTQLNSIQLQLPLLSSLQEYKGIGNRRRQVHRFHVISALDSKHVLLIR